MAKKKVNRKQLEPVQDKEVYKFEDIITVDDRQSTLSVKADISTRKTTWKISAYLTTIQVDPSNEDVTNASIDRLTQIIREAVSFCIERRSEILESIGDYDPAQMKLDVV